MTTYMRLGDRPRVYTNGAYLTPMKIRCHSGDRYIWVVYAFENDTFMDGEYRHTVGCIAQTKGSLIYKLSDGIQMDVDELPDFISMCVECDNLTYDEGETNWDVNGDPYCPECYAKLTKGI
jgi:hypothetical protein